MCSDISIYSVSDTNTIIDAEYLSWAWKLSKYRMLVVCSNGMRWTEQTENEGQTKEKQMINEMNNISKVHRTFKWMNGWIEKAWTSSVNVD